MAPERPRQGAVHALAKVGAALRLKGNAEFIPAEAKKSMRARGHVVELYRAAAGVPGGLERSRGEPGLEPRRAPSPQPRLEARLRAAGRVRAREYEHDARRSQR